MAINSEWYLSIRYRHTLLFDRSPNFCLLHVINAQMKNDIKKWWDKKLFELKQSNHNTVLHILQILQSSWLRTQLFKWVPKLKMFIIYFRTWDSPNCKVITIASKEHDNHGPYVPRYDISLHTYILRSLMNADLEL